MSAADRLDLDQIAALLRQQGEAIERLAQRIPAAPSPILLADEARVHVKIDSLPTFYRWCRDNRVRPCSHGRYSLRALDAALHRESMRSKKPRKASEKPPHDLAA